MLKKFVLIVLAGLIALVAVAAVSGDESPISQGGLQALQGQLIPDELEKLHQRMLPVFEIPGVVFTDADEQNNRLTVAVEHQKRSKAVEKKLKRLGVPLEIVDIVKSDPIVPAVTLQDRVRPLQGGLQISFMSGLFVYRCTEGFNAVRSGVEGFVVNSHCTARRSSVEGTNHYQPTIATGNLIGAEIADPPFFTGGMCPLLRRCRYSDTAYDQRAAGVTADLGFIKKTPSVNSGSITIAGSFRVTSEAPSNAVVGETLNKVGRTTGWTQGQVTNTCVNAGVFGTNIVMLCQDFVRAKVAGGDSGSPVFKITDRDDVQLYGILWGSNLGGTTFVYSPMVNVQRSGELGPITTCASGFSC